MSLPSEVRRLRVLGVPAKPYIRLQLHLDELLRELEIIEIGEATGSAPVPREMSQLVRSILDRYAAERETAWRQAQEAAEQGRERVDIVIDVPVEAAGAVVELTDLLEQADRLSREGQLLVTPLSEDLLELRSWIGAEVLAQLREGRGPTPCPL